jgi:NIPSNAP
MSLYEMRTYTLHPGKIPEATKHYQEIGWPVLQRGGFDKYLVGYFIADTGMLNQLVHIWKFADDNDRRAFWTRLRAEKDFSEGFFQQRFRPLLMTMEMKLLTPAAWGHHP